MSNHEQPNVILDACVLYAAPVRDILLNIAEMELFFPKWSVLIQEEWIVNLLKNRPDLSKKRLEKTIKTMDWAFPNALVTDFEPLIPTIDLPDENDKHVVAAAIKSEASIIVTFNLKDFPKYSLIKFDIEVTHPDKFISNLFHKNPNEVRQAFENQLKSLKNPPVFVEQLLKTFEKCGLHQIVELLNTER